MTRHEPDISIRAMTDADVAAVCDLHARSFAVLARDAHSAVQIEAHVALIRAPAYLADLRGANLLLAVSADGAIVGSAGWQAMPDRDRTARIRKVFVDPGMARRGLGRRLVEAAEREARASGLRDVFVRANVNAVPLYRALGYRDVEAGAMPVADGVTLPVVFMRKP